MVGGVSKKWERPVASSPVISLPDFLPEKSTYNFLAQFVLTTQN